jgi:hypothetical protein
LKIQLLLLTEIGFSGRTHTGTPTLVSPSFWETWDSNPYVVGHSHVHRLRIVMETNEMCDLFTEVVKSVHISPGFSLSL